MRRRHFLALGAATLITPKLALAARPVRELAFHNLHTAESVRVPYWVDGHYDADALAEIARVLRDHRNDESHPINRGLLDLLHQLTGKLERTSHIQVISGYRSPASNAKLRRQGRGVAKRSLHMQGKAIDLRFERVPLKHVHQAALGLRSGGVGYYAKSGFVHLDVGRVRRWGG
ncbi:MAG: DUF882 domain-containing protein [Gammaproteobacteria bacterium]|nr:DUF882 domain-containing protein [Gammaproteobacteria bacterium]